MDYFSAGWCNLTWTPWISFSADKYEFRNIPAERGLYRIRPVGKDFLMYIGQTGRALRERLNELRHNTLKETMPFNDPHTAAPSLWAWKDAEGFSYECSAAILSDNTLQRLGWECYLLWKYRLEYGSSTLCNFGRFHPKYKKSSDRSRGLVGGKLTDEQTNPAGEKSYPPLLPKGSPVDEHWMGLSWSEKISLTKDSFLKIPHTPGIYILFDKNTDELIYIGESSNISRRIQDHMRKAWDGRTLQFAFNVQPDTILPHNLKELENDLVGWFFSENKKIPPYQFRNYH